MKRGEVGDGIAGRLLDLEAVALLYVALPNVIFLSGWIVAPLGPFAAAALAMLTGWILLRRRGTVAGVSRTAYLASAIVVALVWCLIGGEGHFLSAASDWWVRDAVLLDLVRNRWPVIYRVDGVDLLLRTPVGFYLPASIVGKMFGIRAGELALLAWTATGVSITFALLLRDRPTPFAASIRIAVFVAFSGMDILPTLARNGSHQLGAMIEWWARVLNYSSMTTNLFWAPNHTVPGWIGIAWLLGQKPRDLCIPVAAMFVVLMPISAPLTALGLAPIMAAGIVHRLWIDRGSVRIDSVIDVRVILSAAICVAWIFPYLVSGAGELNGGFSTDILWIRDEFTARYIEFVVFEFIGIAILLLTRRPRDPLLWVAVGVLCILPIFRFGPANDLVMRSSIPALALLAIHSGRWLSVPVAMTRDLPARVAIIGLLAIGAVTPFLEMTRVLVEGPWAMNVHASLIEVTRGTHYLTPLAQPWLEQFMAKP